MTLALLSSGAVYGSAQTTYNGQPLTKVLFQGHERWEEGRKQAQDIGYHDGLHDGRWDLDHHRPFRLEKEASFRNADHGYQPFYGDRARYQEEYRHAYERGYREGYHR